MGDGRRPGEAGLSEPPSVEPVRGLEHFGALVRSRRMVRAFTDEPVLPETVEEICDLARRAPSAGNTQGLDLLVLDDPEATSAYWDVTLPEPRRTTFRWRRLLSAPVLILLVTDPEAYADRYGEPDKAATGLGAGPNAWPVPYWWVDAGAAAEHILLGAVAADLGACLFGPFDHEPALAETFGVPAGRRLVATIALGHPDADEPGRSASRPRRALHDVIHRNAW